MEILQDELQKSYRELLKSNAMIEDCVDRLLDMKMERISRALYKKPVIHDGEMYEYKGTRFRKYISAGCVQGTIIIYLFKALPDYGPLTEKERKLVKEIEAEGDCEKLGHLAYELRCLKHSLDIVETVEYSYYLNGILDDEFLRKGMMWGKETLIESSIK